MGSAAYQINAEGVGHDQNVPNAHLNSVWLLVALAGNAANAAHLLRHLRRTPIADGADAGDVCVERAADAQCDAARAAGIGRDLLAGHTFAVVVSKPGKAYRLARCF